MCSGGEVRRHCDAQRTTMTRVVGGLTLWLDHPDEVIPDRLRGT